MPPSAFNTTPIIRNQGIEAARFSLCYAVILLHVMGPPRAPWQVIALAACNAAVPFFFIASGFFNKASPLSSWTSIARPSLRILAIYAVWLAIYQIFFIATTGGPIFHMVDLVTGGGAYHLWFLPALALAQVLVSAGYRLGVPRILLLTCMTLATVGLISGVIAHTIGRDALPGTRALAAPLYFLAGKLWARYGWVPKPATCIIAIAIFWPLSIALDGGLMTYGLGLSVFGLVLSIRPGRVVTILARFGRLSLGIYSVHLLLLWFILPHANSVVLPQALVKAALTLVAASIASLAIAVLPGLWRLASYRRIGGVHPRGPARSSVVETT